MKDVSFIIGSGFSNPYPNHIPGVEELSKLLASIKSDNIYFHTSRNIVQVQSGGDKMSQNNVIYTKFYEKLLKFYLDFDVQSEFNYEDFFDYYYYRLNEISKDIDLNAFIDSFKKEFPADYSRLYSASDLLLGVHNIYSQLISQFLHRDEFYGDSNYSEFPHYNNFVRLTKEIIANSKLYIHSLNHDLLLEDILKNRDNFSDGFSDGYQENGSKYYGEISTNNSNISKQERIRLKYYSDRYSGDICIYKLHGSIDTYYLSDNTRIKNVPWILRYFKEIENENGYTYEQVIQETFPDFLTGKKAKEIFYKQPYYKGLLNHFIANIQSSALLIFIGYGFGDEMLNHIINRNFDFNNKPVAIIDIVENDQLKNRLPFKISRMKHIQKSISEITPEDVSSIMKLLL